ncbi:YrhC family protein [Halobacillus sp. ACCC02827]|uniref:YrhC family protein n=1 Tax=Bacillaceae TaxID=186817 RepID=UPI0002A5104B|nr:MULTISPECIES: YrhC family protein [Bacillaceae]ELK45532.1 hypothetical protein D479_14797 [Halobacillus sp. BAB-2008]QHT47238.1 hypothetical protein M662_12320 [Bacillus sp. SB49]WJE14469.1 YrhC family protein [Halobacillus sp. ACCC02827]
MESTEWKKKIADYKRFIMTLLIFSSYLYIGTLISLYEYGTATYMYLYPLIGAALITAFLMTMKIRKWQRLSADK